MAAQERTCNDEKGLCSVREAAEDAADGAEQRAAAVAVAQKQNEPRECDGAVRQQIQQRRAVALPEFLRQPQSLSPKLRLRQSIAILRTLK